MILGLATTGLDSKNDDIVKISYKIIDDYSDTIEQGSLDARPRDSYLLYGDEEALLYNGLTREELKSYEDPEEVGFKLLRMIKKYSKQSKLRIVGYNLHFDYPFLERFMKIHCGVNLSDFVEYGIDLAKVVPFYEFCKGIRFKSRKFISVLDYFGITFNPKDVTSKVECVERLFEIFKRGAFVDEEIGFIEGM